MGATHIDIRETHIVGSGSRERIVSPAQCAALKRCHIRLCGLTEADQDFCFIRQRPTMSQVLLCLGGSGRVLHNGSWEQMMTGQAYVTPPLLTHAYRCERDWSLMWLQYAPDYVLPQMYPQLQDLDGTDAAIIMDKLYNEVYGAADPHCLQSWTQLLHTCISRLLGMTPKRNRLDALWQEIAQDLSATWSIADMAAFLAISEEHLRRLCQQQFGMSPLKYLTRLRMERAGHLLQATGLSVADVAQQVSYQNAFAFSTAFKRWAGVAPTTWRERHA